MKRKFIALVFFGMFATVYLFVGLRHRFDDDFPSTKQHHPEKLKIFEIGENSVPEEYLENSSNITRMIAIYNKNQRILNYEKFGPITNATVLITIQVHKRVFYLSHLIESLKEAKDISTSLLIISHDIYDDASNQLVEEIDFCMVMQIFYPFSIQTHPFTFPGSDAKDCPRNATSLQVESRNCTGQKDKHGHYREAKFTQMKHHWWWKLNRIFDQLEATKYHTGFLLLLEEDHFIAEDFIPVMKLLKDMMVKKCESCNIISLGTYTEFINQVNYKIMEVHPWITNRYNMGMAFNRSTWNAIKSCASFFCDHDDYNYDFSLQNVNRKCLIEKFLTAVIKGPRVYHIGTCGVHHHAKTDCKLDGVVKEVKKKLKTAKIKQQLYPRNLKLGRVNLIQPMSELKLNGGWGDERDKSLCFNMTIS